MYINGTDISTYSGTVMSFNPQPTQIDNVVHIPPSTGNVLMIGSENRGKPLYVNIWIDSTSIDDSIQKYSKLKLALNQCTLQRKNTTMYYDCTLQSDSIKTNVVGRIIEVEFSFICTQYSAQTSKSPTALNTLYDINNQGTATTPAIIRFKPTGSAFADKSIIFSLYPYYLNSNVYDQQCYSIDLTSEDIGKEIVINSEDVTFRIGGNNEISRLNISGYRTRVSGYNQITGLPNLYSLDELPIMEFPNLQSGITKFKIETSEFITTNNGFTCSITWKPRWL